MARGRSVRSAEKTARLLGLLRSGETIGVACRKAGYAYSTVWDWRKADPELDQAIREAEAEGTETLLSQLQVRGFHGWEEPVFYKGRKVGTVRKFSDTAALFTLHQRDPKRFNTRLQVEHGGQGRAPLQIIQKVYHIGADGAVYSTGRPVVIEGHSIAPVDVAERVAEPEAGTDAADVRDATGGPMRIIQKTYLRDDVAGGSVDEAKARGGAVTLTLKRREF